jgi:hypothetical protein
MVVGRSVNWESTDKFTNYQFINYHYSYRSASIGFSFAAWLAG